MESIQLTITGMKCSGCVNTVENILKNSDGIDNVSVSINTREAINWMKNNYGAE